MVGAGVEKRGGVEPGVVSGASTDELLDELSLGETSLLEVELLLDEHGEELLPLGSNPEHEMEPRGNNMA